MAWIGLKSGCPDATEVCAREDYCPQFSILWGSRVSEAVSGLALVNVRMARRRDRNTVPPAAASPLKRGDRAVCAGRRVGLAHLVRVSASSALLIDGVRVGAVVRRRCDDAAVPIDGDGCS